LGVSRSIGHRCADDERRQQRLALVSDGVVVVGRLDVHLAVAGERDRGAGGGELGVGSRAP
jgi:hypothetical protein